MASGGSANRWGRVPTHARGTVVWKDSGGAKPAPFAQTVQRYQETKGILPEHEPFLVVGALWAAKVAMNLDTSGGGKFTPLIPLYYPVDNASVKAKSLMIYAGTVRVEERESNGRIVSVLRHTFVAGDGRYIVTDFSSVEPVR